MDVDLTVGKVWELDFYVLLGGFENWSETILGENIVLLVGLCFLSFIYWSVNSHIQSCDSVDYGCFCILELSVHHLHLHVALIQIYLAGIKRKILLQIVLHIVLWASFYLRGKLIVLLVSWNFPYTFCWRNPFNTSCECLGIHLCLWMLHLVSLFSLLVERCCKEWWFLLSNHGVCARHLMIFVSYISNTKWGFRLL